jgi:XTP/dITP diphosphohydrolase
VTQFVLASGNLHKLHEFRGILVEHEVLPMPAGVALPPEGVTTFRDNAMTKARALAAAAMAAGGAAPGAVADVDPDAAAPAAPLFIADDSGLEVEALDWRPGVRSSRYAGRDGDDAANVAKLLGELAGLSVGARRARFVCCMACVLPDGRAYESRGEWWGAIAPQPRGSGGFGYDPVFVPKGSDLTVAQWSQELKDRSSHRALAGRALLATLAEEGALDGA